MRRVGWVALPAFVLLLAGCGGMGSLFKSEPVPVADLRGRWWLEARDTAGCANGRASNIHFTLELDDVGHDGAHAVNEQRSSWKSDWAFGSVAGQVGSGWLGTGAEATLEFRLGLTVVWTYRGSIESGGAVSHGTLEQWMGRLGEELGRVPCENEAALTKE